MSEEFFSINNQHCKVSIVFLQFFFYLFIYLFAFQVRCLCHVHIVKNKSNAHTIIHCLFASSHIQRKAKQVKSKSEERDKNKPKSIKWMKKEWSERADNEKDGTRKKSVIFQFKNVFLHSDLLVGYKAAAAAFRCCFCCRLHV